MSWVLSSCRGRRRRRRGPEGVLRRVGLAVVVSLLVAGALTESHAVTGRLSLQLVNLGGGSGGLSGDAVWAKTWWNGSPQGPGPYEGPTSGGAAICIWHDFGPGLANLNNGLSEASLPLSFWQAPDGGGHPGIWGVDEWAESRLRSGAATDHFDLVACPDAGQVPASGGVVEANLPRAFPPNSSPLYVWLFWDTVRDPPAGGLPGVIGEAFDDSCLSFHENRRYARTASYAQVTEPLYDRSRYRYRHYVRQLQPAIEILEPIIVRLGYAVD